MILRKPYAFFIKIFKPIHIFMSVLLIYLIYLSNNILTFFNNYMNTPNSVVGQNIREELVSSMLYIIPIILIIFSLIFLGIMFSKKKPFSFYIVSIFTFLVVLVINVYTSSFLGMMEKSITTIKIVKLNHDLILISMFIQIISFIILIIRGFGINFKKFNFDSDINKFNISDADKEEFELSINIDLNDSKRRRKKKIREFKYLYKENKLIFNFIVILIFIAISSVSIYFAFFSKQVNVEGTIYNMNKFSFKVNKSFILNQSFDGTKLTDNYLIVIDTSMASNYNKTSLFLKDFSLQVDDIIFPVQTKYSNKLADLGVTYDQNNLTSEYKNFIFIFEVPVKYIESDFDFVYNEEGNKTKIRIKPQEIVSNKIEKVKKIKDKIDFNDSLGNISFSVENYDIEDYFLIKYNYCPNKNNCIISKEYIRPTINENFDKTILKLNVEYTDESDLETNNFYNFFSRFGSIYYKINETWYSQKTKFEELKSVKTDNKNNVYIGINSKIKDASSIKFVFNIRNANYEYILK